MLSLAGAWRKRGASLCLSRHAEQGQPQQEADPRLPQARSLRRYSELSVELMKDTHAPVDDEMKLRSASRRAGRPTGGSDRLARTELLSANLLSPYTRPP